MNVTALTGRLTFQPELKSTSSGKSVTNFTLAVKRPHTADKTDFIDCVAWRDRAEFICRYFQRGMKIEVSGVLQTREYDKDGVHIKRTELNVETADFAESKKETDSQPSSSFSQPAPNYSQQEQSDFEEIVDDDDELPF